jgi:hypothetical protein
VNETKLQYGVSPLIEKLSLDKDWATKFARLGKLKVSDSPIVGIEVLTEAWYLNGKPIKHSLHSMMEIEERIALVWFWKNKQPRIYRLTHKLIEPLLFEVKYNGALGIHSIISEQDGLSYFMEFVPRFSAVDYVVNALGYNLEKLVELIESNEEIKPSYDWFGGIQNNGNGIAINEFIKDICENPVAEMKRQIEFLRKWKYF